MKDTKLKEHHALLLGTYAVESRDHLLHESAQALCLWVVVGFKQGGGFRKQGKQIYIIGFSHELNPILNAVQYVGNLK